MRRLYAISQQPDGVDIVSELWRQVWPQVLWSDLLWDGLLHVWPVQFAAHNDASWHVPLSIDIEFQVSSDEPLQLPWDWLAKNLLYAPAAGLRSQANPIAPQQLQEDLQQATLIAGWPRAAETLLNVSLHRPAQADQLQQIMSQSLRHYAGQDPENWNEHDEYGFPQAWGPPIYSQIAYKWFDVLQAIRRAEGCNNRQLVPSTS